MSLLSVLRVGLNGAQSSDPPRKWDFEPGQTSNASWAEV
jgi:hypothetical protein